MTRRLFVTLLLAGLPWSIQAQAPMRWTVYRWRFGRYLPLAVVDDVPLEVPCFSFGQRPTWAWGERIAVAVRPWRSVTEAQTWFGARYRVR